MDGDDGMDGKDGQRGPRGFRRLKPNKQKDAADDSMDDDMEDRDTMTASTATMASQPIPVATSVPVPMATQSKQQVDYREMLTVQAEVQRMMETWRQEQHHVKMAEKVHTNITTQNETQRNSILQQFFSVTQPSVPLPQAPQQDNELRNTVMERDTLTSISKHSNYFARTRALRATDDACVGGPSETIAVFCTHSESLARV
jgi:hypothetical protein